MLGFARACVHAQHLARAARFGRPSRRFETEGHYSCFWKVWCKDTGLDVRVFEHGGKKLVSGKPQPFCKKMWKDSEKVSGEIVVDNEFRVVVLTNHAPADALRELEDPLPLQHLEPVVVVCGGS